MKKWEKEIVQKQINDEQKVIWRLRDSYKIAMKDVEEKIQVLQARPQTQSVIYQLKYQQELQKQLENTFSKMSQEWYKDIDRYFKGCYEEGFFETMYSLHNQGIPIILPFNQEEMAQMAAQSDYEGIKLSQKLYDDAIETARISRQEMTRGIANNEDWATIANRISKRGGIAVYNATRIVRTESGRIHSEVRMNTMMKAKDEGADVVKQWDSTVDGRTRSTHIHLDGQLRELEQPFKSPSGATAMYPRGFGVAAEDINCRCEMLQRARWALDKSELDKCVGDLTNATDEQLQTWADKLGVSVDELIKASNGIIEPDGTINHSIKAKNYNDFKKKYKKRLEEIESVDTNDLDFKKKVDTAKQKYRETMAEEPKLRKEVQDLKDEKERLNVKRRETEREIINVETRKPKRMITDLNPDEVNAKIAKLELEKTELDELLDRYYNRPERGTAEYDAWRKWKTESGFNYSEAVDRQTRIYSDIAELEEKKKLYSNYQKWEVEKQKIPILQKRLSEIEEEIAKIDPKIQSVNGKIQTLYKDAEKYVLEAGKAVGKRVKETPYYVEETVKLSKLREEKQSVLQRYLTEKDQTKKNEFARKYWQIDREIVTLNDGRKSAENLKTILSEVRPMGSSGFNVKQHLSNSRSEVRGAIESAYDYYPSEWVKKSVERNKLTVKKVNRGFYSDFNNEIAISGDNFASQFETAVHELGHRLEYTIPEIRNSESVFYKRRTEGEELVWMGEGYRRDEVTRKDDFLSSYMGKDYNDSAFELVSMGFQYAYIEPETLAKDPDMESWIYGILSML